MFQHKNNFHPARLRERQDLDPSEQDIKVYQTTT